MKNIFLASRFIVIFLFVLISCGEPNSCVDADFNKEICSQQLLFATSSTSSQSSVGSNNIFLESAILYCSFAIITENECKQDKKKSPQLFER